MTFQVEYDETRRQYIVARDIWRIVPSATPSGRYADPKAERRAPELAEALNRVYANG